METMETARFLLDEAAMSFRAIIITGPCRKELRRSAERELRLVLHGGRKYGMMDYSNAMQCIRKERMNMYITCLDVEGVLVPEIWIAFAEASGIPELKTNHPR